MLKLDYANCLSSRVGSHGIDPAFIHRTSEGAAAVGAHSRRLAKSRGTGWERWRQLPFDPMRSEHVAAVKAAAAKCAGKFENMVVLGIGGSALGNIALHNALTPATYNLMRERGERGEKGKRPRLFVVDNVDPAYFSAVMEFCEGCRGGLKSTLFNVISKSGETAETARSS